MYGFVTRLITSRTGGETVRRSLRYRSSRTLSRVHTTSRGVHPTAGASTPARNLSAFRVRRAVRLKSRRMRARTAVGSARPSGISGHPRHWRLAPAEFRLLDLLAQIADLALEHRDLPEQPVDVAP